MFKINKLINYHLTKGSNYSAGRNNQGIITVRHRGCIIKRNFYFVDYKRSIINLDFVILNIRPVPKKSAFLALIVYENGLFSYILVPEKAYNGQLILANLYLGLMIGNHISLTNLPYGVVVYNLESTLGTGGVFARSAGSFVKLLTKFANKNNKLLVQLKSGDQYLINKNCTATLGINSNVSHQLKFSKKASDSRKQGKRPSVRGIAMNPVDHPHGGRTNGGRPSVTPAGIITKGKKTRKKFISKNVIFKRHA